MYAFTETLKLHDKYQVEVKFTYPLNRDKRVNEYHVDAFFFLPTNLSINPLTYSKTDFYNDTYDYIRLKTPTVRLSVMTSGADAPMRKLEKSMCRLSGTVDGKEKNSAASDYGERVRMFCSILRSALRDEELSLEQNANAPDFRERVAKYLEESDAVANEFRSLRPILDSPDVPESAKPLFLHVDEYISITMNKYRCKLHDFIGRTPFPPDEASEIQSGIYRRLRAEITYRKQCCYPSIPDPRGDNEELVYRESCLKKAMASVLFLKTNVRRDGVLIENIVFGIAAGLAMTFATVFAYLTKSFFLQEFSLFFIVTVIAAYMCKDRIKELSRAYLYSKIKRYIYDYKTTISSTLGKVVGLCQESFSFMQESTLNEEIRKIRNKGALSDLENSSFGENVILARKHITLYSKECKNIYTDFKVDGIVNIMRFNVRKFLWKMDNPAKLLRVPSEDGTIITVEAKRVYHVNLIFKYGMEGEKESYARFRLVLSRNGIKRIDTFPVIEAKGPENRSTLKLSLPVRYFFR